MAKFGDHIPLVRRQDIRGYIPAKPVWQMRPLGLDTVRSHARDMERTAARFYRQALTRATDASTRKLLGDLAEEEEKHDQIAAGLEEKILTTSARGAEAENERRRFVLQIIQPGLVGLMDGSVSTLAPVFAAAFATHNSWNAFLVGLAASIGAGISMGFAEALSDDGKLSGRGAPLLRGLVCGLMTTAGGIGHTLPFLIPYFYTATVIALVVVIIELSAIAWIQWRYMETSAADGGRESDDRRRFGAGGGNSDRLKLRTRGPYDWSAPVNGTNDHAAVDIGARDRHLPVGRQPLRAAGEAGWNGTW